MITFHECEDVIEKSVQRITVWHHESYGVITKGDLERRIFHTNNRVFFLLNVKNSK